MRVASKTILLLSAVAIGAAAPVCARADLSADELWARLRRDGHVVLIRHALAPGTLDPPGFELDDCRTQRNLSAEGREQARRLGEVARARGARVGKVLSSRWCRAKETAALAFGKYETWPELDSFVGADRKDLPRRAARIREEIAAWSGPGTLVLVSHQFVLSAIVQRSFPEAAMIVLEPRPDGTFLVLGAMDPAG